MQLPGVWFQFIGINQAMMNGEVLWDLWGAVLSEIGWRCAQQATARCEAACNQTGILQLGDADDEIETLVDNVDEAIIRDTEIVEFEAVAASEALFFDLP
jgi:hypothetical protein